MPGYTTRQLDVRLGGHDYHIRALSDRQQFADPDHLAARIGISSALWCLFGQVWPSGRVLAEAMCTFDVAGKRILELGCGLGLSSLVLQRRLADVTASDHHPLAESFLQYNATQNQLPHISYRDLPWETPDAELGRFDLSLENRRATNNQVIHDAAAGMAETRLGLKAATITPTEIGSVGSPNRILREGIDG